MAIKWSRHSIKGWRSRKKVGRLADKSVIRELENMTRVNCDPRMGSGV